MRPISKAGVTWIIATTGVVVFTVLLIAGKITELTLIAGLGLTVISAFVVYFSDRLQELNLKELKLVLQDLQKTKTEIEEMYGGIERLKREPLVLDDAKIQELGLKGGMWVMAVHVMRYVAGCTRRERERLAQIFILEKTPEQIAAALVDKSKDELVFKWNGPETPLDAAPTAGDENVRLNEASRAKDEHRTWPP